MGQEDDPGAVVDAELRVYGVPNLRVADGSIMPTIVSGNTNAPIIMIAEKVADMIKLHWEQYKPGYLEEGELVGSAPATGTMAEQHHVQVNGIKVTGRTARA